MIAAADRLLESAKDCRNTADWHDERASVGGLSERRFHRARAHDWRLIGIALALAAEAFSEEPDE